MASPTTQRPAGTTYPKPYEGTWDEDTGKYLLPNLVGLPFDAMVKNGEGNRHGGDPKYYRLILVHALFGAFAFLIFTPAALVCARFLTGGPRPRLAMAGHIGFQITSVLCLTITFVTGYFAVGEQNWGKNPHHAIGAAVYVGMIFQLFFGAFVRWRTHKKIRKYVPLHKMIHQWLGRGVFLLGLAQIPLGLYVYGSPLALFILYAVVVFIFFVIWFICEFLKERGWFTHGILGRDRRPISTAQPEMAESHQEVEAHPETNDNLEAGNGPASPENSRRSRFSNISWFKNFLPPSGRGRYQSPGYNYPEDGLVSGDTSRAPSTARSPALMGLHPAPGQNHPPVPPIPDGYDSPQLQPPPLQDTALRGSTTLPDGGNPGNNYTDIPEPQQMYDPYISHGAAYAAGQAGNRNRNRNQGQQQYTDMPPSPIGAGGYMEADNGFIPSPGSDNPPTVPLPQRPHRRDRSTDSIPRPNTGNQYAAVPSSPLRGGAGGIGAAGPSNRNPQQQPNIAVQVKLNPDKSVTVRRLQPEEVERERQERARQRRQQNFAREEELLRQRQQEEEARYLQEQQERQQQQQQQSRKSHDQSRSRPTTSGAAAAAPASSIQAPGDAGDNDTPSTLPTPSHPLRHQPSWSANDDHDNLLHTPYTPSVGGQSSTIAHASGGLLGRIPPPSHLSPTQPLSPVSPLTPDPIDRDDSTSPSPMEMPGGIVSPILGMSPVMMKRTPVTQSPVAKVNSPGPLRPSGGSASGSGTAENSEMEQEIVKEQRRRRRREERMGGGSSVAGRYPSTEWT
ncbi:hypothetical protein EX30DRAFT_117577 [Ascodesmis nigricans]|uniref:Cytochrome b561 domain-containing protein n=1 Tax=Ascodesmis nigricans TaxID=341454 RepID=A0A4S2MPL9_9PEZI|nr:hypothetical protein EX30DRAFT_117577 [Ascodesmis nigricans]